ncbi:hypothetical protein D3C80_1192020 [compost metagenome]
MAAGQPAFGLDLGGGQRAHQRGREGALTHLAELGDGLVVIAELHHAAQVKGDGMTLGECQQAVAGIAERQGIEAGEGIVLPIEQGIERPLPVAGGTGGGLAIFTQECDPAPALHQGEGGHGRGDAAADDQHPAVSPCRTGIPGRYGLLRLLVGPVSHQHLPLAAVALGLLHGKASLNEAAAHEAGAGEGGDAGPGAGEAGEAVEQLLRPHLGVLGGGETIQIPGIHQPLWTVGHLGQHVFDVAKPEIEPNSPLGELQAVAAGYRQRPLRDERLTQMSELGPGRQCLAKVGLGERVLFEADKVQASTAIGVASLFQKGGHCRQKVKACAETCFANHEIVTIVV